MRSPGTFGKCCWIRAPSPGPMWNENGWKKLLRGHLKGDRNYTNEIHKRLTLELIHRLFLDDSGEGTTGTRPAVPVATLAD